MSLRKEQCTVLYCFLSVEMTLVGI